MEENKTQEEQLAEQALVRREKLKKLVSEGNDPYQKTKYGTDASSVAVKENYGAYEGKTVSVAGRLMSRRIMGKASFSHISDRDGQIQLYITRQDVGEDVYAAYKKDYDIGDIVGVRGTVFKTQTGEVTIHATHLEMLSKALLPLPEKHNGQDFLPPRGDHPFHSRLSRYARLYRSGHAHSSAARNRGGRAPV